MTTTVSNTPGLRQVVDVEARPFIPLIYNPTTGEYDLATSSDGLLNVATYVWNTSTLSWDKATQAGGGGGGGGAVTIADGADVAEGATTDAAVITDAVGTVSGKLRGLVKWAFERMPTSLGQKLMAASLPVVIASDQSAIPVTQSGAWSTGRTWDLSFAADQVDVTGSTIAIAGGSIVVTDGGGSITVDGPLTDTQLRATPVPVTGLSAATDSIIAVAGGGNFGTKLPTTPSAAATAVVGIASSTIVAATGRTGLVIINTSNSIISLSLNGAAAVLGSGITLYPGGSWTMDEYTYTYSAVEAIASAAASSVAIQEFA